MDAGTSFQVQTPGRISQKGRGCPCSWMASQGTLRQKHSKGFLFGRADCTDKVGICIEMTLSFLSYCYHEGAG